jgi:hypothetical protein
VLRTTARSGLAARHVADWPGAHRFRLPRARAAGSRCRRVEPGQEGGQRHDGGPG